MDKRKSYFIVLDTETCNGLVINDKLDLSQSLVYDIGWAIIDKTGRVYCKRSFMVRDIFLEEKELMQSAYYKDKIPAYFKDLCQGKRVTLSWHSIKKLFRQDCESWNVKAVIAHNAPFDYRSTNNTERWLTKSRHRYFIPYSVPLWDTMKMASDTIAKEKGYIHFCESNGYMTAHKKPRVRVTAEVLYKYISGNNDFIESHTGLEDVIIEAQIFITCLKKHKKMRKSAWS